MRFKVPFPYMHTVCADQIWLPDFSTPAHPPQSLFCFSGQLWFLSSWISAIAHFPPPPHIQLRPFCCVLYDSTCPHGWITLYHVCIPHTLIRSPTAEPSCGRGVSATVNVAVINMGVQGSLPYAFFLMGGWAKENLGKCNWALAKSNSKNHVLRFLLAHVICWWGSQPLRKPALTHYPLL